MRTKIFGVVAAAALLVTAAAVPVLAHHSFAAEFDAKKPVSLQGVVTKMEWINPHSWIHIAVPDETGKVNEWMIEGGPPERFYCGVTSPRLPCPLAPKSL